MGQENTSTNNVKFNSRKVPYEERVDTVIGWLLMNKTERPDFMTLYFNEPDHTGHGSGPDSPEVCTNFSRNCEINFRLNA